METLQALAEQVERLRQIRVLKDSLDEQILELQQKVSGVGVANANSDPDNNQK